MFEDEDPLPRPERHSPIGNWNDFAASRQHHSKVRGRVIGSFSGMDIVILTFRNEPLEKLVQIGPSARVGVLVNHQ